MTEVIRLKGRRQKTRGPFFDKRELGQLLSLYSSRVIKGEWRDYAIDHRDDGAVFSIFRHTHEFPLFAIAKRQQRGQSSPNFILYEGPRKVASSSSLLELMSRFERLPRLVSG